MTSGGSIRFNLYNKKIQRVILLKVDCTHAEKVRQWRHGFGYQTYLQLTCLCIIHFQGQSKSFVHAVLLTLYQKSKGEAQLVYFEGVLPGPGPET